MVRVRLIRILVISLLSFHYLRIDMPVNIIERTGLFDLNIYR